MDEYDEALDWILFHTAYLELHRVNAPKPWEWKVMACWNEITPGAQEKIQQFAPILGMEIHVITPGLAIIYNPKRPSAWAIIKRILYDTFRSLSR